MIPGSTKDKPKVTHLQESLLYCLLFFSDRAQAETNNLFVLLYPELDIFLF